MWHAQPEPQRPRSTDQTADTWRPHRGEITVKMTPSAALACQDILALIFNHLAPNQVPWEGPSETTQERQICRRTLASSARVCRALSQHALNVLWRELNDIQPLLKVLPEYRCVEEQFMLCGAISPEHWSRFQFYAARVRIANARRSTMDSIHPSVWLFLAARCKGSPLMPHLRQFRAYNLSISGAPPITLLLSPTLRVLDLWYGVEDDEENRVRSGHVFASLLQTLPATVPELEQLSYGAEFNLDQEHLQSFTKFQRLKILTTPPSIAFNEYMLQVLSSVTTLQKLSCLVDLSGISALALPSGPFPVLAELDLTGHSDHLATFILACPFPNLKSIRLHITQPPRAGHPRDMFTALCRRCDPARLTSFAAHFLHSFAAGPSSLMEYFEPLLTLSNTTSFHIVFVYTAPSICNDDLVRMGSAWPRLASLHIKQYSERYSQPDVGAPSLSAIIELARRCPDLTTLHVPELDPRALPDSEGGAVPPLGHGLRSVVIDNILPPRSFRVYMGVATVLDRVFPSIDLEEAQSWVSVNGKGWPDVLRLLEAMRVGRTNAGIYADLQRQG